MYKCVCEYRFVFSCKFLHSNACYKLLYTHTIVRACTHIYTLARVYICYLINLHAFTFASMRDTSERSSCENTSGS